MNIQSGQDIILLLTYHVYLHVNTSALVHCETQKWCVITLPALVCAQMCCGMLQNLECVATPSVLESAYMGHTTQYNSIR